jgi:hypothetical protein
MPGRGAAAAAAAVLRVAIPERGLRALTRTRVGVTPRPMYPHGVPSIVPSWGAFHRTLSLSAQRGGHTGVRCGAGGAGPAAGDGQRGVHGLPASAPGLLHRTEPRVVRRRGPGRVTHVRSRRSSYSPHPLSTALLEGPSILILCTYPELSVHPGYQGGGHRWASRVPRVMLNATFATATDVQRLRGFTYHASPLLPKLSLADLLER